MKLQSPRLMLGFKNEPLDEAKYVQRDLEMTLFLNSYSVKKQISINLFLMMI